MSAELVTSERLWYCLSVTDFLRQCAWDGSTPKRLPEVGGNSAVTIASIAHSEELQDANVPLECLSVRVFFGHINWHNRRRVRPSVVGPEAMHLEARDFTVPLANPLTVSVEEFLQHICWEGQPEIAALPQIAQPLAARSVAVDNEMTLNNLSTLF